MAATAAAYNFPPTNFSTYQMNSSAGPSPPDAFAYPKGRSSNSPSSDKISPTTLQSSNNVHVRQLRQPRQPMYLPAALRPPGSTDPSSKATDIPNRPRAPDTPPGSKDNSFDSAKSSASTLMDTSNQSGSDATRSNSDASPFKRGASFNGSDYSDELEDVTGQPTTAHWKPDASSHACSVCNTAFTWFFRRHHCRRCGDVVCDAHSRGRVPLDQNARPHPQGAISKACDPCADEWQVIKRLRHSRANSLAGSQNSSQQGSSPAVPSLAIPQLHKSSDEQRVGSMARSEGGMAWSTF